MKIIKQIISVVFCAIIILTASSCAHMHSWSEWEVSKAATCIDEGKRIRYCTQSRCECVDEETIQRIAHTPIVDETVYPTCVASGLTEGAHCSECNAILIPQYDIPKIDEHNFVSGICSVCYSTKDLLEKEYNNDLPTFFVYTNGATIPDRSHPEYNNYAECQISMVNDQAVEFDETAKLISLKNSSYEISKAFTSAIK